jgi:predicted metalloprotease with PDZ domain
MPTILATALFATGLQAAASAPVAPPASAAPIELQVDLRDAGRKIFRVHETIPVRPGPLRLAYPKWIPGEHSPSGTLSGVTGLRIAGNGARVAWRRDLRDMFAVELVVPEGVQRLDVDFEFLSPGSGGDFGQSVSATPRLVDLEWNQVVFYPVVPGSLSLPVRASVQLPAGWQFATALERAGAGAGGAVQFAGTSLAQLVDSPLIAGQHFRRLDLAPGAKVPVMLDLVADSPANLVLTDAQLRAHRNMVVQAEKLFGGHHYGHYDFLFTLSDSTGHFGLEHHQSSDDRLEAEFFTDADKYVIGAGLLPHEYVHSWNGKFRRPAGLLTTGFEQPMEDELLWVYEGLTQYLGEVLTARAGLWTPEQYRDALAVTAADMSNQTGRSWRPLQDTADEAQVLYFAPGAWANYQRSVDFYAEGTLLWLDVDARLRELSGGKRGIDDFTRAFHGVGGDSIVPVAYTFDDVVATLETVQPGDWRGFLRERLDYVGDRAPLGGIERSGWRLAFDDTQGAVSKAREASRHVVDLMDSLGLVRADGNGDAAKGSVRDVRWGGPAFDAGVAPGMTVVAVDGIAFTPDTLRRAVTDARPAAHGPIRLLVKNLDSYSTMDVTWHQGLRYPHLVRAGGPDRLSSIIAPR